MIRVDEAQKMELFIYLRLHNVLMYVYKKSYIKIMVDLNESITIIYNVCSCLAEYVCVSLCSLASIPLSIGSMISAFPLLFIT